MTAQEHPEPIEPTMVSVPGGIYCTVHGEMDCTLPFCWRCGNHLMDDFERCADPRCRASNDADVQALVEEIKRFWTFHPAPVELLAYKIGQMYASLGPSFLPGEPDREGMQSVPTAGAGS